MLKSCGDSVHPCLTGAKLGYFHFGVWDIAARQQGVAHQIWKGVSGVEVIKTRA